MRLVEALAQGGCGTFVNTGSAWQHVDGEPYRPKSLYAATKQAFEDIVHFYAGAAARSASARWSCTTPTARTITGTSSSPRSGRRSRRVNRS